MIAPSLLKLLKHTWGEALSPEMKGLPLLSFDPGKTTGVALFKGPHLVKGWQETTPDLPKATKTYKHLIRTHKPKIVIVEDYKVYRWKVKDHAWADLLTARLIGCLETLCIMQEIPMVKQMAHLPKQFCTDQKLKDWGFYIKGAPHARDAIRHACYFLLFNLPKRRELL